MSLKPHTQKFSPSTGIFWLKYISTSYYKYFALQGEIFSDLKAEL